MGTFTSLLMVTDLLSSRTSSLDLMLLGLLETSGIRRELSTAFLESPAEPFLGPSHDFTDVGTWGEIKSEVHSSSTCSTSKHVKLFKTGKGETTATVFWVFNIFLPSRCWLLSTRDFRISAITGNVPELLAVVAFGIAPLL